jgi:hypothetical protein
MSNPNIKRNVRNLSAAALATLGIAAVGEGVKSVTSHPKPPIAPLVKSIESEPVKGVHVKTTEILSSPTKSPIVNPYLVENTLEGGNTVIGARVEPRKTGDHIDSAKISLAHPKDVPAGVSVGHSKIVENIAGEGVVAQFNDPNAINLPSGEVEVNITAIESNGATTTVQENIPYSQPPVRPS